MPLYTSGTGNEWVIYGSSTDSSSSNHYINSTARWDEKELIVRPAQFDERKFNSKLLEAIVNAKLLYGYLLLMAPYKSKAANDRRTLEYYEISSYLFDFNSREHFDNPALGNYNRALLLGILELIPGKMRKANALKEALVSLKNGDVNSAAIAAFKTKETVEKKADELGWNKEGNRFISPYKDMDSRKLTIRGIEKSEIIDLFGFAGAKSIWEPKITFDGFEFVAASMKSKK